MPCPTCIEQCGRGTSVCWCWCHNNTAISPDVTPAQPAFSPSPNFIPMFAPPATCLWCGRPAGGEQLLTVNTENTQQSFHLGCYNQSERYNELKARLDEIIGLLRGRAHDN